MENTVNQFNEAMKRFENNEKRTKQNESKTTDVIKTLIDTDWSKDNDAQMKAVQLLKGIALSDEPEANAFMKKIDGFTSGMKANESKLSDSDVIALGKKAGKINEGTNDKKIEKLWDKIEETLGAEDFLMALYKSMSGDEIKEAVEYIARMHEI